MSKWVVRRATIEDREWLLKQCEKFIAYLNLGIEYNPQHTASLVDGFIHDHEHKYALVATKDGEPQGVIAATLQPHILNPNLTTLSEVMWWVDEEKRNSRAALILLDALDTVGKLVADFTVMSVEAHSAVNARALEKRGYKKQELAFIKKN